MPLGVGLAWSVPLRAERVKTVPLRHRRCVPTSRARTWLHDASARLCGDILQFFRRQGYFYCSTREYYQIGKKTRNVGCRMNHCHRQVVLLSSRDSTVKTLSVNVLLQCLTLKKKSHLKVNSNHCAVLSESTLP